MQRLKSIIVLAVILALVWIMLTGVENRDEWIVGGIALVLTVLVFFRPAGVYGGLRCSPKGIVLIPVYLVVFLWELIKSNLDVAVRVLNPRLPINPGIVRFKTKMDSDLGKLILANSITLTPGTLTVDVEDDTLTVHWIDVDAAAPEDAGKKIAGRFEKLLKEIAK
ncbi:MAG: Na+/H+ antiporter subunit E [Spirochaetales bacterium]|nr:Na+/H+ antiporter subunit E [Spirochaetales bacterium]MCF7939443.1 Na+/H+ antiporter subunit E [Spirochaetales bacterium]